MQAREPIRPSRYGDTPRLGLREQVLVVIGVMLVHVLLALAVVFGLGHVAAMVTGDAALAPLDAIDVPLDRPSPSPSPTLVAASHEPEGAEGAAGRKAEAKAIMAPPPRLRVPAMHAAPAASTGDADRSGATAGGTGTGGGNVGAGTGSGGSGNGPGGRYLAQKAEHIAGDINATRDYPAATRDARLGKSVTVALVVGTDGRVKGCSIVAASGEPQSDAITCRLATERFRFRPALDQAGAAIESTYGWRQRWWAP